MEENIDKYSDEVIYALENEGLLSGDIVAILGLSLSKILSQYTLNIRTKAVESICNNLQQLLEEENGTDI